MAASDPRLILLHAEEYRRCAMILELSIKDEHAHVPMNLCYAFALELYLKFLIRTEKGEDSKNAHNLVQLFGWLKPDTQAEIQHKWDNPKPGVAAIRAAAEEASGKVRTFRETLEEAKDGFTRLRYAYQYPHGSIVWSAGDIMECTRKVIFERFPNIYAGSRLPLPPGVINQNQINCVEKVSVKHPLRQPPAKR